MPTLTELCRVLADDLVPVTESLPERAVTGIHISELIDPTVYLEGGELLLTVGMGLTGHTAQAHAYTARLARFGVAALGFGVGPVHDALPESLVRACEVTGLPLLVINDAELAAHSARLDSRLAKFRKVLVITLGFGIGAALINRSP